MRESGGVRIRGRWPMVSGCEDAEWAVLGLLVDDVFSFAVLPVDGLAVQRTWHLAGMRGTGNRS
ncbi:hypothetical protein SAMN04489732_102305 [Amycolatopsis saalfeldensis]|uniref:Uncharacterized protein n=1 Tax=Amycolatopsis saalfeldensis TaxID=394193 RepID=A0A1H8SWK1_9PSEU|nr:hypothetical protein SAMN04489732_102305 [Amycolatopsis saalfeldensis]